MESQKILNKYIHELITSYGKLTNDNYTLCFSTLHDDEQGELVKLYMEANGLETTECVHGNDFNINNAYTNALLKMLESDTPETREDFAKLVKRNIITYYANPIQSEIDDACNDYLHEEHNAHGYYAKRTNTGDFYWSKP